MMESIGMQGTTPVVPFVIKNFDLSTIDDLCLTMAQYGKVVIKKKLADVSIDGDTVSVRLTQAETLALDPRANIENQIRFKIGAQVFATKITYTRIEKALCKEII